MVTTTTIKIEDEVKDMLNKIKIHPRETYNDILIRLIKLFKEKTR